MVISLLVGVFLGWLMAFSTMSYPKAEVASW